MSAIVISSGHIERFDQDRFVALQSGGIIRPEAEASLSKRGSCIERLTIPPRSDARLQAKLRTAKAPSKPSRNGRTDFARSFRRKSGICARKCVDDLFVFFRLEAASAVNQRRRRVSAAARRAQNSELLRLACARNLPAASASAHRPGGASRRCCCRALDQNAIERSLCEIVPTECRSSQSLPNDACIRDAEALEIFAQKFEALRRRDRRRRSCRCSPSAARCKPSCRRARRRRRARFRQAAARAIRRRARCSDPGCSNRRARALRSDRRKLTKLVRPAAKRFADILRAKSSARCLQRLIRA